MYEKKPQQNCVALSSSDHDGDLIILQVQEAGLIWVHSEEYIHFHVPTSAWTELFRVIRLEGDAT